MSKLLKEFIASKASFRTVYNTSSIGLTKKIKRICILDSSFNPPHLGHLSLVKESLNYNFNEIQSEDKIVLLLLSVKNADKIVPQPASFDHRLEMMIKLADYINTSFKVDVKVGLTNHAKFVDKSESIKAYLNDNLLLTSGTRLTFLVGFDTLVRILDPKYYTTGTLQQCLNSFFEISDLFCLTRNDGSISLEGQFQYLESMSNGKLENIPKSWSSKIFLFHNESLRLSEISSSYIRTNIREGKEEWFDKSIPDIRNYIIKEGIYN